MIPPLTDHEREAFYKVRYDLRKANAKAEKFQRKYENLKQHVLTQQSQLKYERQGRKAGRELTVRTVLRRDDLLFLALQRGALDFDEALRFKTNALSAEQVKAWYLERLSAQILGES